MPGTADVAGQHTVLRVLVVTQGQWGERMADNVQRFAPATWTVQRWAAPRVIPPVVDDPDEYLPSELAPADLVLVVGETAGVVQLVPDLVRLVGARAVIAPIDRNESLPPGLVRQLAAWLAALNVAVVFPRPFCSLTTSTYNRPPVLVSYDNELISEFATYFGRPRFRLSVDAERRIAGAEVEVDSACGCARAVAAGLVGCPVDEAEFEAGMLHHHYPCLASMNQDADYRDTLMHVSGHLLQEAVKEQIKDHLAPTPYLRPQGRVDSLDPTSSEQE